MGEVPTLAEMWAMVQRLSASDGRGTPPYGNTTQDSRSHVPRTEGYQEPITHPYRSTRMQSRGGSAHEAPALLTRLTQAPEIPPRASQFVHEPSTLSQSDAPLAPFTQQTPRWLSDPYQARMSDIDGRLNTSSANEARRQSADRTLHMLPVGQVRRSARRLAPSSRRGGASHPRLPHLPRAPRIEDCFGTDDDGEPILKLIIKVYPAFVSTCFKLYLYTVGLTYPLVFWSCMAAHTAFFTHSFENLSMQY